MRTLILLLISTISMYSYGSDNKRQNIEELLVLTNVEAMIGAIHAQMNPTIHKIIQTQLNISPTDEQKFNEYLSKYENLIRSEINWERMKEPTIDIYLKHYSNKEIQDMLIFYQSETGKSMLKKMPAVMTDSMQMSQEMLKSFLPSFHALTEKLKNKGQ